MRFLLRAIAFLLCLLFTQTALAQDTSISRAYDTVEDTSEQHFADYWRRANEAILSSEGRSKLNSGTVRPSLRAMSNPVRYGLVAPENAREAITVADMICDNRESGGLQLRCRMPNEARPRRIRPTGEACRGRPDLFTLVPEGCGHPYVMTVEGRSVLLTRLIPPAVTPSAVASPTPAPTPAPAPDPARQDGAETLARATRLQQEISELRQATQWQQDTLVDSERRLAHSYFALALLVLVILAAAGIVWRQHQALKREHANRQNLLAEQVRDLSESVHRVSFARARAEADMKRLEGYVGKMRGGARQFTAAVAQRSLALLRENEELARQLEEARNSQPSIVIDHAAYDTGEAVREAVEAAVRETEERARASEARLREAQDVERRFAQKRIDKLQNHVRELRDDLAHAEERAKDRESAAARLAQDRSGVDGANQRLRVTNHGLKSLLQRTIGYMADLGLDPPEWLVVPTADPLFVSTPPEHPTNSGRVCSRLWRRDYGRHRHPSSTTASRPFRSDDREPCDTRRCRRTRNASTPRSGRPTNAYAGCTWSRS